MSFYVTTPIYYVNAAPHLGHAYTTIAADVMARHHRQRAEDVFFLTGTDEHGEPVALAAEAAGRTPKEHADLNAAHFEALTPRLNATNDFFIRTSDPRHVRAVQDVLQRVKDNGHVYEGEYEGWYCPRCADFKNDTEIADGNRCPIHEIELTREKETNWFFALSRFQEQLEELFAQREDFVLPTSRRNEALAFIRSGLHDVSLSRSTLTWGVPVPWDPEQVFYVWFDALLNYVTALQFADPGEDLTERFWPADVHIVGKDILKFHTVYWPALLLAAGLPVPRRVFVHGFLLGSDGRKMSKSLGNGLDPFEVMDLYGVDALRYYLLRDVAFGADGSVSMDGVKARFEGELANEFGNLASRTIAMVLKYRDGAVPGVDVDPALLDAFASLPQTVADRVDALELTPALDAIWELVKRLNRYVEETTPWVLAKDEARAAELDTALASLVAGVRSLAVLLHPWLPEATEKLRGALGAPSTAYADAALVAGGVTQVEKLAPLFPKQ
ncbi:methionine--tRNA ligase [Paraconexibacter algicola]|uniref:Methionine--tRNA ligase n=1 Tax=Paraconexibacter algicola TaxID=2133960 RepID=A0A2T4ULR8_9ACTN|nr:methionine--tRNA ligase [Paraconexibacter algicola]PTL60180.1 methionine--tRNA ligase [Paraconexibacter algicola]